MDNSKKIYGIILAVFLSGFVSLPVAFGAVSSRHGVERFYHGNGNLAQEFRYKKGIIVRKRTFYSNGKILFDCKYKKGYPFVIKTFYKNGKRKSLWTRKSGVVKTYFPDGTLKNTVRTTSKNLTEDFPASFIFPSLKNK